MSSENVRWAEPNKIYEAIYFETPIIVSSETYLADKVRKLGIGYDVDAMNEQSIVGFINRISKVGIEETVKSIKKINKETVINRNDVFFEKLENMLPQ